jgi:chemotaxis protein CheX
MSAAAALTDTVVNDCITRAVKNVFQTMIKRPAVDCVGAACTEPRPTSFHVIGSVGFAGEANGIVYLCMSDELAIFATSEVLGMSRAEVEMTGPDILKDTIGEITNMTAGAFKNQIYDLGFPCKLTLPTLLRGKTLTVSAIKGTSRHFAEFACESHRLYVDIQIKI